MKTDAEIAERLYGASNLGDDVAPESRLDAIVLGDLIDAERNKALVDDDRQLAGALDTARKEIVSTLSGLGLSQGAAKKFIERVKANYEHPPADEAHADLRQFDAEETLRVRHGWQEDAPAKLSAARGLLSEIASKAPRFAAYFNEATGHDVELLKLLSEVAEHRARGRR